jgi:hypothetical protein
MANQIRHPMARAALIPANRLTVALPRESRAALMAFTWELVRGQRSVICGQRCSQSSRTCARRVRVRAIRPPPTTIMPRLIRVAGGQPVPSAAIRAMTPSGAITTPVKKPIQSSRLGRERA